jgi:hypothetical protein
MIALLLGSIPLFAKAQSSTELEISVKSVSRTIEDEPKEIHVVIIEFELTNRSGSTAIYVHFRKATEHSTSEVEELVVYRAPKGIGPSFYVVMLRTTPEFYSLDHALYLQIRDGLRFVRVPPGECSND